MTILINPEMNTNTIFMEPPPVVVVSDVVETADHNNLAILCDYNDANIDNVVCAMFDQLLVMNVMFNFNPMTATWSCSYFPTYYITEVVFGLSLRHQNNMLMIEKHYVSGHQETYSSLCNSIVGEIVDTITTVNQ